jgi:aminoglycoside phosphotransferase (APT) family kinase protein
MTSVAGAPVPPPEAGRRPQTSTRDPKRLQADLQAWFRAQPGQSSRVEVTDLQMPTTAGMSSETLLLEVSGLTGGIPDRLVARLAPDPEALPVFPTYDLARQARVMTLVAQRTAVPVPAVRFHEPDPAALGVPFLVMDRVEGQVPPDVMPYTMDGWVLAATEAQRRRLLGTSVAVLAGIHDIAAAPAELAFLDDGHPGATPLARHLAGQRDYYAWVAGQGRRSPLIERAFTWLEDHWPDEITDGGLSWGDARIGNILYRDFTPVAVLDWEMAGVAPREVDLGWFCFLHSFFQDLTERAGMPGIPDLVPAQVVADAYAALTGHRPRRLQFFEVYAALRHAVVMFRVAQRQLRFGEMEPPADPDDTILHRVLLESLLDR